MNGHSKKFLLLMLLLAPAKMFACATCYGGNIDSPMADGMNWGILTLLVIITTVLFSVLAFFIHIIRKGELAAAAATAQNTIEVSKV